MIVNSRDDKDTLQDKEITEENGEKRKSKDQSATSLSPEIDKESRYITNRIIPKIGATGRILADVAFVLKEFNSVNSIMAVLTNNTSTIAGCEAFYSSLEKNLKESCRPLFTSSK